MMIKKEFVGGNDLETNFQVPGCDSRVFLFKLIHKQMEILVREYKGEALTSSQLIADKFKKRHSDVLRAIRSLEIDRDFWKRNFALRLKTKQLTVGNTREKYYTLTRDGFTVLVMGFTGREAMKFKLEYIEAFNKMEATLHQSIPKDYPSALRALAEAVEQKALTEVKLKETEPHVLFSKTVQATDKTIDMKKVAGILGIKGFGRNKLFEFLRVESILMPDNIPYRNFIDRDYFEVREVVMSTRKGDRLFTQTIVTQKGLNYIIKKLKQFAIIKSTEESVEIK